MLNNKLIKILLITSLIWVSGLLSAQSFQVNGVISDADDNTTVIGASIVVKNTKLGTITDFDGNFSLQTNTPNDTLIISFIGYKTQTIPLKGRNIINVKLVQEVTVLDDVVVTALGIKREKKSLGYSVTELSGEDLQTAKDANVMNQLSGKVAGLEISSASGGSASSSKIVMRGYNSLTGDNQALVVVDGVPIDNSTVSSAAGEWGGRDFGSGVSDINPDDIESISVLKGASASALYGSRAANGVILITTKKGAPGKNGNKIQVGFSSNTSIEIPYILWDLQNEYGAGRDGQFARPWVINSDGIPVYNADLYEAFGSWGPKMEGQTIIDWDGKEKLFLPQANNYKDFFRTGIMANNSVSIGGALNEHTYRLTISDLRNPDIVPNSGMNRTNLGLNLGAKLHEKLRINLYTSYVNQKYNNRVGLSDAHNNVNRNFVQMPRHVSLESMENYIMDENGLAQTWHMDWPWMSNPFWDILYEQNYD
ncbi:MAG: TonB-dependent receptor plug domain-containing protein, partial [Bacteroidales bacterium]|nr:TonB-dependent receptor plug domain-containing protein [Bacteroidales bacterium]